MSEALSPRKPSLKASALSLVREGKPDLGAAKYREYLALNEWDDDAWAGLGGALRRMGQIDGAIDCYAKAFEINPKSTYAAVNVVVLSKARNTEGDAVRLDEYLPNAMKLIRSKIRLAEEENPNQVDYWTWYDLGMLQLISGEVSAALSSYNYAAESTPQNAVETFRSVISGLEFLTEHNGQIDGIERVLADLRRRHDVAAGNSGTTS